MRKHGPRGVGNCPRCGAVPSHQKRKPRKTSDFGRMWPICDTDPVDGVVCPKCGIGFRAEQFNHDGTYFEDLNEAFELIPMFCPNCGARVVKE